MAVPVPHAAPLPFTLADGNEIIVDGVAGPGDAFSINLCDAPDLDHQTILHFNPRFYQNEVVRTHNAGGWGVEERHGGFPFCKGSAYQLKIVVRNHAFQIFVNNQLFTDFNHRMAKEAARYLFITGDTSITRIGFGETIMNPPVPMTTQIPGGLYPGRILYVSGIPNPGGERFSVNLVCGPSFDNCDVSLHMDNRFNYTHQNTVVRTHKQNGGWGNEEIQQPFFPFVQNQPFEIMILVEHAGFKIAVNNQHFIEFNHRIQPCQRADHLYVMGDVRLTQVRIQ